VYADTPVRRHADTASLWLRLRRAVAICSVTAEINDEFGMI
jgi:hypothetical protein